MRLSEPRWALRTLPNDALGGEIPALARALSLPEVVARLLWLRDLKTSADARSFLAPQLADLVPPAALPDADRAADRLARAVRDRERIAVCGDYDVDGMTGTALLVRFFRLAGGDVVWAIPDRDEDGYGLGVPAVERLAADGVRVAVTVDNGISAHEAVDRANALGIDVVVTDHHLPGETLPNAYAVVNPSRRDHAGAHGGTSLCGCALAFKTAWAVADRLRHLSGGEGATAFRAFLRDAMGLVALATVTDVMPLRGENRILVTAGLASLSSSPHAGIRALLEAAGVGPAALTTEDVAWKIGPRLNAAGRLSRPDLVIDLLTCTEEGRARDLARTLTQANETRRKIEKEVLAQAVDQAVLQAGDAGRRSLVVHGEGWHRGVIGIVAARLVDLHQRPTVVIGFDGDEGRGSCRTLPTVDLHRALTQCGGHLRRYGGHAMAAGLEIGRSSITQFTDAFEDAVQSQVGSTDPGWGRTLAIDAETAVDEWTLEAVEAVKRLEPFGAGNPEPVFLVRGARVAGRAKLMGQGSTHLSFALKQRAGAVRVVAFRRADLFDLASADGLLDLVVTTSVNEWRGIRTPELRLVDMRPHVPVAEAQPR